MFSLEILSEMLADVRFIIELTNPTNSFIININEYRRKFGKEVGVGDVCFFLTMRCFNDAMFSNS